MQHVTPPVDIRFWPLIDTGAERPVAVIRAYGNRASLDTSLLLRRAPRVAVNESAIAGSDDS